MGLRKLERNIVKNNIIKDGHSVKKSFEKEWSNFREKKYVVKDEEGNVISDKTPRNTMPKKQSHFDNQEQYFNMFNWIDSLKQQKTENTSGN